MTEEWFAICKDCGTEFGYSAEAERRGVARGLSRPERCVECRQRHRREISTLGLTHLELQPLGAPPPEGLAAGSLGRLVRPPREHSLRKSEGNYDFGKFAIKDHHLLEFFALLDRRQVCVIVAPTGAGKSTLLPYRLMVPPASLPKDYFTRGGQILITQPRIQATRNIPDFVATRLHGSSLGPGFDIGFRHSGTPQMDRANKLVYVTDGTLINMIVRNELTQLGLIMIDEAHERSLNIDLILGLLKRQLPRFPHLRLIIASATIDSQKFVDFFGGNQVAGFYEFPGERPHPIEVRYHDGEPVPPKQMPAQMPALVAEKVLSILRGMDDGREKEGDILAFLHGEKPILRAVSEICEGVDADRSLSGRVDVLPLFTRLPQRDQDAALQPKKDPSRRRVVISTNVAETSLTVDGIVHVVDSGLINQSEWDLATHTTFIAATRHSRAGCRQRWGRAGRKSPGVAHCLYTEAQFNDEAIFSSYSRPEIQRAPLEQIVLTAKAAGVDDVQTFPWIESPPIAELGRVPEVLQRMGALDGDGDLTQHGIELRSFAEEPDISNLMILADRFGCATEMATILAMRRLRSLRDLFQWDRTWDASTKRVVHQRQQALMAACRDDLEFSLKIWEAWEGTLFQRNQNAQRLAWAGENFVVHETFDRRVSTDREALLNGLSGHKKEDETRPADFRLLGKLRILLAHGLSTHLYRRQTGNGTEDGRYVPYLHEPERSPHLIALHENANVAISHDSICGQHFPEFFVCARRRRWLERRSPFKEPSVHVCASFIVVLEEAWLKTGSMGWIELAHFIASETRTMSGALKGEAIPKALFVDQYFPLGSRVMVQKADGILRIEQIAKAPPKIRASRRWGYSLDTADAIESDDAEEDTFDINAEAFGLATDWPDEEESATPFLPHPFEPGSFEARMEGTNVASGRVDAFVCGFDVSDSDSPVVCVRLPSKTPQIVQFSKRFRVGEEVSVEVVAVERFLQERLTYLIVKEPETGLEIVLDPYDLSLIGRNFAFETRVKSGDPLVVSIEEIQLPRSKDELGHVRVSRLRFSAEAVLQYIEKFDGKLVEADIADVTEDGIYIWLNPDAPANEEAVGAFVPSSLLPYRPDEMELHQRCQVITRRREFAGRRSFARAVRSASNDFARTVKNTRTLNWNAGRGVVELLGPLGWEDRCALLSVSGENEDLVEVVERLFRVSYDLEVRVIDVELFRELEEAMRSEEQIQCTVIKVERQGIVVNLEAGGRCNVSREELPVGGADDLSAFAPVGSNLALWVRELDMSKNRILLSALVSVVFVVPSEKMGLLIGPLGANVKRLEIETGASIRIPRGTNEVRVSGRDLATVRKAVDAIEDQINHYCATVRLDSRCVRILFHDEAKLLKTIQHGLKMRVDVERGVANRNTGLIHLQGSKLDDFRMALLFLQNADPGAVFVVSARRVGRITPEIPPPRRSTTRPTPKKAKSNVPLAPSLTRADTTVGLSAPVERDVVITPEAMRKLTARPMGFFKALFGGVPETSIVQRIERLYSVSISVRSNSILRICGESQAYVEHAATALKNAST